MCSVKRSEKAFINGIQIASRKILQNNAKKENKTEIIPRPIV